MNLYFSIFEQPKCCVSGAYRVLFDEAFELLEVVVAHARLEVREVFVGLLELLELQAEAGQTARQGDELDFVEVAEVREFLRQVFLGEVDGHDDQEGREVVFGVGVGLDFEGPHGLFVEADAVRDDLAAGHAVDRAEEAVDGLGFDRARDVADPQVRSDCGGLLHVVQALAVEVAEAALRHRAADHGFFCGVRRRVFGADDLLELPG